MSTTPRRPKVAQQRQIRFTCESCGRVSPVISTDNPYGYEAANVGWRMKLKPECIGTSSVWWCQHCVLDAGATAKDYWEALDGKHYV